MIHASRKSRAGFLTDTGDMGRLIREFDWGSTSLRPIDTWPQSLKTAVGLMLGSRHPMWIGWGPEMVFLYNDAYLHVLGPAKHPSALGQPASQVWSEIWDVCGPLADRVFAKGEASFVDDVRLFMDRGDFVEETFYSFSYSPIPDEHGNVLGLFCPSTDVTPKILNARRLATLSELAAGSLSQKTTATACASAAATVAKNPDDIPFALLYLSDESATSALLEQCVGDIGADASPQEIALDEQKSAGAPWPVARVFQSVRSETVPVRGLTGLPLGPEGMQVREAVVLPLTLHGAQKPYGILIAGVNPCRPLDPGYHTFYELLTAQIATAIQNARSVEEERKRADKLAELDRAKTVFFSNVSHEFRTPLTLMLGPIKTLLASAEERSPQDREQLAIAHRNSLRLLKLVNSLLEFSRIEAGRMKTSFVAADLSALTADLASTFRSAMETGGLSFKVDCPPLPKPVYVDTEMWEKVVLNLLSNAFKFTLAGSVTVRLRAEGSHAVLLVEDTGTGIPAAELPRIFERFHRVDGAKGRSYEGTGIGLALIQELVKLHGGTISVTSEPGQGTAFRVELPIESRPSAAADPAGEVQQTGQIARAFVEEASGFLQRDSGAAPAAADAETPERATGKLGRILLADDNADMREHILHLLAEEYDITTAEDGEAALVRIRQNPPDLVLSDFMMPRMDGLRLLQNLRSDSSLQTIPVIFISARAGEEMRVEGLKAGADDYLVKPFTANELKARVGTHIRMALARQKALAREMSLRSEAVVARDQVLEVLESITDGYVALDKDWQITYVNSEAQRLNAMTRDELVGKNHWELFPSAVGTTIFHELTRAAQERVPVEFENYYSPWKRWFHVKAYPQPGGGLSVFYEDVTPRKNAEGDREALLVREQEARAEAETLNGIAQLLAGELDLQKLVQSATDAATKITGAKFGAFFYNLLDEHGESYSLYTLSGAPREAFERFGMPRNTAVFEPTFRGTQVVRSDDIMKEPAYGQNPPHRGMPEGHLPVRSYLAVPVISRSGQVLGGMFFGHPEPGVFTARAERMAIGIASHASVALDNAHLFEKAERELRQRRQAEDALRESESRFRQMIDSLPAAIYTTDAEGRLTHYNPAAETLVGRKPVLGSDRWCVSWKLYQGDGTFLPHDKCPMAAALKDGTVTQGAECIGERPDGNRFWFTPFPTPLRNVSGEVVGGINMLLDITARKEAEEALRRSEERFRGVFNSSAIGVAVLDLHARFLQANHAFCAITGYTEGELKERDCAAITHAEDRASMQAQLERLTCGDIETFALEKRYLRKDGWVVWVQNSVSLLRNSGGEPENIIALSEDITERKENERAVNHLAAIVDSSEDAIVSKTLDGIITSWNKGAEKVFGYDAGEVVGKSVTIIIPPDRLDEEPAILRRLRNGDKVDHFETRRQRKDGTLIDVSLTISPVRNKQGQIIGASKIARDITGRKSAEKALKDSEARFRELAEVGPQFIWVTRGDGVVEYVNQRWTDYAGLALADMSDAAKRASAIHPEDFPEMQSRWERCLATGEAFQMEGRLCNCEGAYRWFMIRSVPIRDEHGNVIRWFGASTDIHDQKMTEEDLRCANSDLEQFAYSASHDLQEPLRSVKIYSELLTKRYRHKLDDQALEFCDYLRAGATRMEMLVRDLLAYTQVTKLELDGEQSDACHALQAVIENLSTAISESGATIESGPLPSVPVHRTHLQQLFQNLVGNAIKYRSPDRIPRIQVTADRQGECWIFSVADNGIGIEPEYKERVFGLFKRLHSGDEYSGTGIGLAICQRIVERYQGRIWVESEPGQGSTFFFTFPV